MGFYIVCPYFIHQQHKRPTISCEDCVRLFESNEHKFDHIKKYCEDQWQTCPFAADLTEIYERTIYMYNKKLLSDIGRLKKKVEKLEKTVEDMNQIAKDNHDLYRQELNALRNKNGNLEKQKSWAESVLAAYLMHQAGPDGIVELKLDELFGSMVGYDLQFQIDEDAKVARAKVTKREEKDND